MLHTELCRLIGIDYPIIQAGMGGATNAALAAAVSNAGGLGSLGTLFRDPKEFAQEVRSLKEMTSRPFALNQVVPAFLPEIHETIVAARPRIMSFALDDPGPYVRDAHEIGALVMHQVTNVPQAMRAAESGVDIIVAQGSEAGGYSGAVATFPLVPQIVDAVSPLPVVAAGGIFDGRGIAAALMLGALGVNIGTRFLATKEAPFEEWKQPILQASSEDAVHIDVYNIATPMPGTMGYGTTIRGIRTPEVEKWMADPTGVRAQPEAVFDSLSGANKARMPVAGQSVGGVRDVLSAGDLVRQMAEEAIKALSFQGRVTLAKSRKQ